MVVSVVWPVQGLLWFLRHPRVWWRPLLGQVAVLAATGLSAVAVGCALWPAGPLAWGMVLPLAGAVAAGAAAGAVAWLVLSPLVTAFVLDGLAAAVRREAGLAVHDPGVIPALRAIAATAGERLLWIVVALGSAFLGPFGPLVAAYALGRGACLDAMDTALAAADRRRERRWFLREERWGAIPAGGLYLLLGLGLVTWLLWMPALVCGASILVRGTESPDEGTPERQRHIDARDHLP